MSTNSENTDTLRDRIEAYVTLADDYRADPELRTRAESDPAGVLAERGVETPAGVDLRIVANTAETVHVILPPDPNAALPDEALEGVSAGISVIIDPSGNIIFGPSFEDGIGIEQRWNRLGGRP